MKHRSYLLPVALLAVVATGCASSNSAADIEIPVGATEIRLFSEEAPEDYFSTVRIALEDAGFSMINVSNVRRNLLTGRMDIGRSIELEMSVLEVEEIIGADECVAVLHGRTDRGDAHYTGSRTDESYAFKHMVDIASRIAHSRMEFRTR